MRKSKNLYANPYMPTSLVDFKKVRIIASIRKQTRLNTSIKPRGRDVVSKPLENSQFKPILAIFSFTKPFKNNAVQKPLITKAMIMKLIEFKKQRE